MMEVHGLNALQIILASGYTGLTDVGHIPAVVARLASLPEHVTLVRATEHVNFHLAAKRDDPVRSDTTIYPWIVGAAPGVVQAPGYFLAGSKPYQFQLVKRTTAPSKYPELELLQLAIKFQPTKGELWLSSVWLLTDGSLARIRRRGIEIGT